MYLNEHKMKIFNKRLNFICFSIFLILWFSLNSIMEAAQGVGDSQLNSNPLWISFKLSFIISTSLLVILLLVRFLWYYIASKKRTLTNTKNNNQPT